MPLQKSGMNMRLSISSSNDRLPQGAWLGPLIGAALLSLMAVIAWEWAVRAKGFEPAPVTDTKELWAETRLRASHMGRDAVILVGTSRIQLGINLGVLARYAPSYPVQLAINGNPFWAVLKDLAEDDTINGTVIVDISMQSIGPPRGFSVAADWVAYTRNSARSQEKVFFMPFERVLRDRISKALAYRSVGVRPQDLLAAQLQGTTIHGSYIKMAAGRSVWADYGRIDAHKLYVQRVTIEKGSLPIAPIEIADFTEQLIALERMVQKIHRRGGHVIFLCMPTSGEIARMENIRFPRKRYWDQLTKTTTARAIHYQDHPELAKYELADGSHLDYRQAISFTEALGPILFPTSGSQ